MANFQNLVMAPTQNGASNQCLTGCMYQIVQSTVVQGKNILHLVPVINAKDNSAPLVPSPVITNQPMLNVQQPVRFSMPSSSNVPLPCPANGKLVQQLGSTNYIITTPQNPAEVSKSIRVDNQHVAPQNTAVLQDKPPLRLPSNPQTGTPSFFIMNTKPSSVPMKTIPIFPSTHGLQIPAQAEMKSVPVSSLPFSIQQRILPSTTSNDTSKIPSVVYVSPVNATKKALPSTKPSNPTITTIPTSSLMTPILVPAVRSSPTTPSKGPLKWVVQENTESVIPVKSSTETQLKLRSLMSGEKAPSEANPTTASAGSNVTQIKDNTLVMCNNKIYFVTKQGSELKSPIQIKQEPPEKIPLQMGQGNDLANKVVEVVLSKNNLSSPNSKQILSSPPPATPPPKPTSPRPTPPNPKPCTPPPSKSIPEVIYIDDDDDDDDVIITYQKPPNAPRQPPHRTSSAKAFTPSAFLGCVSCSSDHHVQMVKEKEVERTQTAKSPVTRIVDERTLRAKFGLFMQEKIVLNRISPPLNPESDSNSRDADEDVTVDPESQEKRKSDFSEPSNILKRRRSENDSGFSITAVTTDLSGHFWGAPPPLAAFSDVRHTTSAETACETSAACANPSTLHATPSSSAPEMYTEPTDNPSLYANQDITGHFSQVSLPRQRFHIESSAFPDETTKDEKIQRLKEVLKEREQALEALRRQKWS